MKLLERVERGKKFQPPRILVYGTEGIGKSTLAAKAPNPIFIQTEDGLSEIDCAKFPISRTAEEVFEALKELRYLEHEFKTVVIDSLDWLERLVHDLVCREWGVKSIEKADGGYAKGYTHALTHWRHIVSELSALRDEKGMSVILTAHSNIVRFESPETLAYDRFAPRLHKHVTALITEWCDAVLFATQKYRTEKEDLGFGKERVIAHGVGANGGERILRTVGSPACIAKNRYNLSPEIPLSWDAIVSGMVLNQQNGGTNG